MTRLSACLWTATALLGASSVVHAGHVPVAPEHLLLSPHLARILQGHEHSVDFTEKLQVNQLTILESGGFAITAHSLQLNSSAWFTSDVASLAGARGVVCAGDESGYTLSLPITSAGSVADALRGHSKTTSWLASLPVEARQAAEVRMASVPAADLLLSELHGRQLIFDHTAMTAAGLKTVRCEGLLAAAVASAPGNPALTAPRPFEVTEAARIGAQLRLKLSPADRSARFIAPHVASQTVISPNPGRTASRWWKVDHSDEEHSAHRGDGASSVVDRKVPVKHRSLARRAMAVDEPLAPVAAAAAPASSSAAPRARRPVDTHPHLDSLLARLVGGHEAESVAAYKELTSGGVRIPGAVTRVVALGGPAYVEKNFTYNWDAFDINYNSATGRARQTISFGVPYAYCDNCWVDADIGFTFAFDVCHDIITLDPTCPPNDTRLSVQYIDLYVDGMIGATMQATAANVPANTDAGLVYPSTFHTFNTTTIPLFDSVAIAVAPSFGLGAAILSDAGLPGNVTMGFELTTDQAQFGVTYDHTNGWQTLHVWDPDVYVNLDPAVDITSSAAATTKLSIIPQLNATISITSSLASASAPVVVNPYLDMGVYVAGPGADASCDSVEGSYQIGYALDIGAVVGELTADVEGFNINLWKGTTVYKPDLVGPNFIDCATCSGCTAN